MSKVGTGIAVTLGMLAVAGGATIGGLKINKLNKDVEAKNASLVAEQQKAEDVQNQYTVVLNNNKNLEAQLEEKNNTIASQEELLQEKDNTIASQEAELATKNSTIEELNNSIIEKNTAIANLQNELKVQTAPVHYYSTGEDFLASTENYNKNDLIFIGKTEGSLWAINNAGYYSVVLKFTGENATTSHDNCTLCYGSGCESCNNVGLSGYELITINEYIEYTIETNLNESYLKFYNKNPFEQETIDYFEINNGTFKLTKTDGNVVESNDYSLLKDKFSNYFIKYIVNDEENFITLKHYARALDNPNLELTEAENTFTLNVFYKNQSDDMHTYEISWVKFTSNTNASAFLFAESAQLEFNYEVLQDGEGNKFVKLYNASGKEYYINMNYYAVQ